MAELRCPKCGEVFTVDETSYDMLLKEVKGNEFEKELHERLEIIKKEQQLNAELEIAKIKKELVETQKNLDIAKRDNDAQIKEALINQKEELNNQNRIIDSLKAELIKQKNDLEKDKENALFKAKSENELNNEKLNNKYTNEINELKNKISRNEAEKELAIREEKEILNKKISEQKLLIAKMTDELTNKKMESKLELAKLEEKYNSELKAKEDLISYYKDLKTKMSTKLVGETLEQHCQIEFNKIRPTIFNSKNIYFDKDNDSSSGSKGDFIYKEYTDDGVEVLSIMFEMKNENETTATKHKNEHFFKELDKDRKEKNCEYAVLVSMLEADNDLYNAGITDVSYEYDKMYVVRPQCFIPIITLLRNAAMNNINAKRELIIMKNQNMDLSNFEQNLLDFQNDFQYNYEQATKKFDKSIEEIDKAIATLQKTKENLLGVNNQLRIANDKAQKVTIKKLTKNAPSVKEKLEDLKNNNN